MSGKNQKFLNLLVFCLLDKWIWISLSNFNTNHWNDFSRFRLFIKFSLKIQSGRKFHWLFKQILFSFSKFILVIPPKQQVESRPKLVKRRRIINNNTDYEYDLGRIKQPKKAKMKPAEKSTEKDQAFYVRISTIFSSVKTFLLWVRFW